MAADTSGCRAIHADSGTALRAFGAGLTVRDVARRYRVSPDKVRAWIRRGELLAINTSSAMCRRPRYVIPPEALAEFERGRVVAAPPRPTRRRRRTAMIDYYPD